MSKLVYTSHTYKSVDKSASIALYVLRKGFLPIDPFLTLPPPVLDILELGEEERLNLDFEILEKCDELWVFGNITKGVRAEIEWWRTHRVTAPIFLGWEVVNE